MGNFCHMSQESRASALDLRTSMVFQLYLCPQDSVAIENDGGQEALAYNSSGAADDISTLVQV